MSGFLLPNIIAASTGTASGAPTAGSWLKGSLAYDGAGNLWLCTVSGSPGTWTEITGGGSSGVSSFNTRTGAVTLEEADVLATFTAKGGILVGAGSGSGEELAVGTDTYVLTADSTATAGVKWAAASGGGGVLASVQYAPATQKAYSTASQTPTAADNTNLTMSFTTTSSGIVLFGLWSGGGNPQANLGVMDHTTGALYGTLVLPFSGNAANGMGMMIATLTPNTSYQVDMAIASQSTSTSFATAGIRTTGYIGPYYSMGMIAWAA